VVSAVRAVNRHLDLSLDFEVRFRGDKHSYTDDWFSDENIYTVGIQRGLSQLHTFYTVFHEMKHVEQFATGRLEHAWGGGHHWEGDFVPAATSYFDRPWEIEAFQFERHVDSMFEPMCVKKVAEARNRLLTSGRKPEKTGA
jgi:hypothetical protein